MKLFLKNIISFLIILYGSIFIALISSNYLINERANFKLQSNTNKIILGNSHPAGTFNDSLISNTKNLADPGECYFYSYQKLKEILKQNPQIDTVYVELNPKTILIREDDKLWKKHQVPKYLAFFDYEDHYLLAKDNSIGYQQEILMSIGANAKRILLNQYNFKDSIGGFRHVTSYRLEEIIDTISYDPQKQYSLNQKKLSKYDITYLKKLIVLCKEKNITFIFVRSPYHKKFDGRMYEDIFQDYRGENFNTIPFLDFKDFPMKNKEFKDLQHLNYKGARKFSLWFEKHNS
jgi:hypothetical protein